jgi:TPR repeat protein
VRQVNITGQGWLKNSLIGGFILTVTYLLVPAPAIANMARHDRWTETAVPASRLLAPQAKSDSVIGSRLTHEILNTGLLNHRFRKAQEAVEQEDYDRAVSILRLLAEQGHPDTQFLLGSAYSNGLGIKLDRQQAIRWYQLAAEQGHIDAQYNMGVAYATGNGVAMDATKAASWYRRAALQGSTEAQYNLGLLYANGTGVPKNMFQAGRWWYQAAMHGDAAAQYALGLMFVRGDGVPQDIDMGVHWWYLSASQGFELAQNALHELGIIVFSQ